MENMMENKLYNESAYPGLTCKDAADLDRLNAQNEWGITIDELCSLIHLHKKARTEGDARTMSMIIYRLTDINFHTECKLLTAGKYKEAEQEAMYG